MRTFITAFFTTLRRGMERLHLNRVFVTSLVFSLAIALQEMAGSKDQSVKAYLLALFIAAIGFISNRWKAKGLSLAGQLLAVVPALMERAEGAPIPWAQLILSLVVAAVLAWLGNDAGTPPVAQQEGAAEPLNA